MSQQKNKKFLGWLAIIIASIVGVAIMAVSVLGALGLPKAAAQELPPEDTTEDLFPVEDLAAVPEPTPEPVVNSTVDEWTWHFYNQELQDDGNGANNYDFGPNPVFENLSLSQVKQVLQDKKPTDTVKVSDIIGSAEIDVLDEDFRIRLRNDPALGAADMAWFDSIMGTRYLGVFYDECEHEWDAAMNKAKSDFMKDHEQYYNALDAFDAYLNSATKKEVRRVEKGLTDQMYMNPFTVDKVPDIIVMETDNHSGWFLVYTFTIKGTTTKEVMYRIDCGYQPTNVAEVMKVKVKPNPNKQQQGGGGSVGGGGISGGGGKAGTSLKGGGTVPGKTPPTPTPSPKPTPKPDPKKYDKDPTKGTPVLPNDTSGPGPDTNNGKGAQYSTADQPGNSNDLTPEQYQQIVKQLEEANNQSRSGGEDNTPSTPPPDSNTTVDSNADSGNGNGSIDTPTPPSDSSVSNDSPGSSWDGPPD